LFAVAYFALLNKQPSNCSGLTHFVCVLDESGGALAALFGLFAVVGVVIAAVEIWLGLSAVRQDRVAFDTVLTESVYEAVHNLRHMAQDYENGVWKTWP